MMGEGSLFKFCLSFASMTRQKEDKKQKEMTRYILGQVWWGKGRCGQARGKRWERQAVDQQFWYQPPLSFIPRGLSYPLVLYFPDRNVSQYWRCVAIWQYLRGVNCWLKDYSASQDLQGNFVRRKAAILKLSMIAFHVNNVCDKQGWDKTGFIRELSPKGRQRWVNFWTFLHSAVMMMICKTNVFSEKGASAFPMVACAQSVKEGAWDKGKTETRAK